MKSIHNGRSRSSPNSRDDDIGTEEEEDRWKEGGGGRNRRLEAALDHPNLPRERGREGGSVWKVSPAGGGHSDANPPPAGGWDVLMIAVVIDESNARARSLARSLGRREEI